MFLDLTLTFSAITACIFYNGWRILNIPLFTFAGMPFTGLGIIFGVFGVLVGIWFIHHFFIKNAD